MKRKGCEGVKIPLGFKAAAVYAGITPASRKKPDLAVWYSHKPCAVAAVFTKNKVQAAPVRVSRQHVMKGCARALLINRGNANAATGPAGLRDAWRSARMLASRISADPHEVLLASTGVIGERLDMAAMDRGIRRAADHLKKNMTDPQDFARAASAIMTTDTFPKTTFGTFSVLGKPVTIWGCAKGAGMIHPDMATMLAVFLTDAKLFARDARTLLRGVVDKSFNRISVDGDTSTNDSVFLMANGCSKAPALAPGRPAWPLFTRTLSAMAEELAVMIVSDGEGAQHTITIDVEKARTPGDALAIARTVAVSPLVKTAVYGRDPNWGRILAAVGRAHVPIRPDRIDIYIGRVAVCSRGTYRRFDERAVKNILKGKNVNIRIVLHQGTSSSRFWTCDLTEKYIKINAEYRT